MHAELRVSTQRRKISRANNLDIRQRGLLQQSLQRIPTPTPTSPKSSGGTLFTLFSRFTARLTAATLTHTNLRRTSRGCPIFLNLCYEGITSPPSPHRPPPRRPPPCRRSSLRHILAGRHVHSAQHLLHRRVHPARVAHHTWCQNKRGAHIYLLTTPESSRQPDTDWLYLVPSARMRDCASSTQPCPASRAAFLHFSSATARIQPVSCPPALHQPRETFGRPSPPRVSPT